MRAALVVLIISALSASPAPAQDASDPGPLLQRIATLWAGGEAGGIARHVAGRGLELEVNGQSLGPVAQRKAAATLRRVFAGQETVSVVTTMTARVAGAEDRAYGELTWSHRSHGGAATERTTIFVGLVREGPGWRVSQIRILP